MRLLTALWDLSLLVEFLVVLMLLCGPWKRRYPKFVAYLVFDLVASFVLNWIASVYPSAYDIVWRFVQVSLVIGRVGVVMESYQRLASSVQLWRFSDGYAFPLAAAATLLFHGAMVRPFRWPNSYLEAIFQVIAASHGLMGFIMVSVVMASHRYSLSGTAELRHAKIMCGYLLVTSACYYLEFQVPQYVGVMLMATAVVCYTAWLCIVVRSNRPLVPAHVKLPEIPRAQVGELSHAD